MKYFYLLIIMLFSSGMQSQTYKAQVSQQDPANPWVITFTHNDWGFFDPGYDALKVYVFINTGHNTDGQNLWDNWGTFAVDMTWNDAVGARQGSFNIKDYVFNGSGGSLNAGNTLNNFGFILIRVPNEGSWTQTEDLFAADYGFTPFTVPTLGVSDVQDKKLYQVVDGKLYTSEKGNLSLEIYEISGKQVKKQDVKANGSPIDLNLNTKGLYLLNVKNSNGKSSVVKFSN